MIEGILWAVLAGVLNGLYALPEKYVKGYAYENTWSLFFLFALIVCPALLAFSLIDNFGAVLCSIESDILLTMVFASVLWGIGVQLWSKAIDYIGISLGFSIFIGTVILIGSILPFIVAGLPSPKALMYIVGGLFVILLGIIANGRAGILRKESEEQKEHMEELSSGKVVRGIIIALIGGVFATGFSLANAVGAEPINAAVEAAGNPKWMGAIAVMFIVYVSGAIYVLPYFVVELTRKGLWGKFAAPAVGGNVGATVVMGIFNFGAAASFAYAASSLGSAGGTVGYAIFNTACIVCAVIGGIMAKEWATAPAKARGILYFALVLMSIGVILIATGNSFNV